MAVLTANANIDRLVDTSLREFPVGAAEHIYRGSLVGLDPAGHAKTFVPCDTFIGVAYEEVNNAAGAAAALDVRVFVEGDFVLTFTGAALTHFGQAVFATNDGTIAAFGHPDAFVGRIVHKDADAANKAVVRLRGMYDKLTQSDTGFHDLVTNFGRGHTLAGDASATTYNNDGWLFKAILGLGNLPIVGTAALNPAMKLQFDVTAEVALASYRTQALFPVAGGATMECTSHLEDHGAAALDVDWGLGSALTTNSEADIDHVDMAQLACFHQNGGADIIEAQSDDATTDVAPVDTTIANLEADAAASFKKFKVMARPGGSVEFWINGARVLATTTFTVLSTAVLQAWFNAEKTADASLLEANIARLRAAGAQIH